MLRRENWVRYRGHTGGEMAWGDGRAHTHTLAHKLLMQTCKNTHVVVRHTDPTQLAVRTRASDARLLKASKFRVKMYL